MSCALHFDIVPTWGSPSYIHIHTYIHHTRAHLPLPLPPRHPSLLFLMFLGCCPKPHKYVPEPNISFYVKAFALLDGGKKKKC